MARVGERRLLGVRADAVGASHARGDMQADRGAIRQMLENIRSQSCEGLALPFLLNWLFGGLARAAE